MKRTKKNTGITLIVLVITIIILLILASVSIAMLTGNNGILTQAKHAKQATIEAAEKENNDFLEIEMRANNSIANIPNLKEGMIPVKWDDSNKTWEIADKNNTGNDWYDYSARSKKWANVVTVKENCSNGKTRTDYLSAGVGTLIPEDDITTMFVWIPRYSYYVKSGYHENANGTGEFAIKFLVGTSDKIIDAPEGQDTAIRSSETNKEKYVVHPAFTADTNLGGTGSELSGIWNNSYNEGITYPTSNNGYKMYNRSVTLTGMSGSSRNNYTNYYSKLVDGSKKDNGDSIKIAYININTSGEATTNYTNTYYRYYTENGQKASTTRNIYGIYDMSGGAWEYVANYLESATSNDYVINFLSKDKKYQTQYAGTGATSSTADRTINYEANKEKYGDAIWETSNGCNGQSSWNLDYSYFPYIDNMFFLHGGNYNGSTGAGVFYFMAVEVAATETIHSV